jgi:hypothetical protein
VAIIVPTVTAETANGIDALENALDNILVIDGPVLTTDCIAPYDRPTPVLIPPYIVASLVMLSMLSLRPVNLIRVSAILLPIKPPTVPGIKMLAMLPIVPATAPVAAPSKGFGALS